MYLSRFVGFAAVAAALSAPLAAQGIPRGARTTQTVTNAPRLMVANPFANAPGDSANAVHMGTALRLEMTSGRPETPSGFLGIAELRPTPA